MLNPDPYKNAQDQNRTAKSIEFHSGQVYSHAKTQQSLEKASLYRWGVNPTTKYRAIAPQVSTVNGKEIVAVRTSMPFGKGTTQTLQHLAAIRQPSLAGEGPVKVQTHHAISIGTYSRLLF